MENLEIFLKNLGVNQRPINDPFLENSHKVCKIFERKGVTADDLEELCHEEMKEFSCNACQATFKNLLDYELHYRDSHDFVCTICKVWKPSARALDMHVEEKHDSFFKVLAEKQPMYRCYVNECNIKFNNPLERIDHCRKVHEFPKSYRFNDSVSHKQKTSVKDSTMEVDEEPKPLTKKNLSINFGKSNKKSFDKKKSKMTESSNLNSTSTEEKKTFSPVTMFIPRQVQQKTYANRLTGNIQSKKNVLESGSLMELEEYLPPTS